MSIRLFSEAKRFLFLSMPLVVALVAGIGARLIDSIMMGYLGPAALAAGALSVSSYILVLVFIFGIIGAAGICIAQAVGAQHYHRVSEYFQQGIYLVLVLCIPMMLTIYYMANLFPYLGQDLHVSFLAKNYLHGITWGVPAFFGFLLLREVFASLEKPNIVMYVTLAALPVNALLDYLFIFNAGDVPQRGMHGIGLAGSITQWLILIALLLYCFRQPILKKYLFVKLSYLKIPDILHILAVGLPAGCVGLFEVGLFAVSAFMMGQVGVIPLAAHQIVIQYVDFAFIIILGLAQAASIRVAHNVGSKNLRSANHVAIVSAIFGLIASTIFAILFYFIPVVLAQVFLHLHHAENSELLNYTQQFFRVAIFFVWFDALQVLANNILRGLKDTLIPMLLGMGSYWIIGLGSAYFLTFYAHLGAIGIWYGLELGVIVSAIILWMRWFYKLSKLDAAR